MENLELDYIKVSETSGIIYKVGKQNEKLGCYITDTTKSYPSRVYFLDTGEVFLTGLAMYRHLKQLQNTLIS